MATSRRDRALGALAAALAFGALAGCGGEMPGDEQPAGRAAQVRLEGDVAVIADSSDQRTITTSTGSTPPVLFLNFEGVTLSPGAEDAPNNRSTIVQSATVIPKFDPKHFKLQEPWLSRQTAIDRIVGKVRRYFGSYNVSVVTKRPASGPYTMIVIGGKRFSNISGRAAGVAPVDCGNARPSEVGFVFTDSISSWTAFPKTIVAVTISHEAGHTYGLDHISPRTAMMNAGSWDLAAPLMGWKSGQTTSTHCAKGGTQDSRQVLAANLRSLGGGHTAPGSCHTGGLFSSDYCSVACLCTEGEGHCNSDSECTSGLKCVAGAGSRHGATSAVAACEKPKSTADTQAPRVAIVQPGDKTITALRFAVHTRVTDNGTISRVEVALDGKRVASKTTTPYSFAVDARAGVHVVTVTAIDAAGNRGSDVVRVRAVDTSSSIPAAPGPPNPLPASDPPPQTQTVGPGPGCALGPGAAPADQAGPLLALALLALLARRRRRQVG